MAATAKLLLGASTAAAVAMLGCASAPLEHPQDQPEHLGTNAAAVTIANCSEAEILAHTPPGRLPILTRAFDWIHRGIWYCQCLGAGGDGYRTDCSGFVSMTWTLAKPGHTTYSFAGGPWADGVSHIISYGELLPGDALNFPGSVSAGSGHVVLFGGWLDDAHTKFCSLEESHTGTQAHVGTRGVDSAYLPIRWNSVAPSCTAHCEGSVMVGADCGKGDCAAFGATCVDDSLGLRCSSVFCPPTGTKDGCWTAGGSKTQTAHCDNGAISIGDCAPFAASCAPALGHCVSNFCVADVDKLPVAHDGCWFADGKMIHCDATGNFTLEACPAGKQCSMVGGIAHCDEAKCPAEGKADVCGNANEIGHCLGGSIVDITKCAAEEACIADESGPRCVAKPSVVTNAGEAPVAQNGAAPDSSDLHGSCAFGMPVPRSSKSGGIELLASIALAFAGLRRLRR